MARIKQHDLFLNDNDQIYFGDNQEAALWYADNELRLDHTISGTHATQGYHLLRKDQMDSEVVSIVYTGPENLLIYWGYPSSFNFSENAWSNERVAQDMAKYTLIVFGDGAQDPSHEDYSNIQAIISRLRSLNLNTKIFGYVNVNQPPNNFETKTDQWDVLEVDGIFMKDAGYDYGTTRSGLNERIDYVHSKNYAKMCFVDSWNMDHIIGTENDPSYPNSTYNPDLNESNLVNSDWYLLDNFPVNTDLYSSNGGYESRFDWYLRGDKAVKHRNVCGIKLAACGVINNDNSNGRVLCDFGFTSSLMWSLEGFGTSDVYYGASSSTVKFWPRPNTSSIGKVWDLCPKVENCEFDNNKYYRYIEFARLGLDFLENIQTSSILNYGATGKTIDFVLTDGVHDYISTENDLYEVVRSFYFPGTRKCTPTTFGVIGSRGNQPTTGYARLYDQTNDIVIVEISWTEEDKDFYLITSLSNLPDSPVIIELQCKTSTQDRAIMLHYMILE